MVDNEKIPEGWVETTLGEVADKILSGWTPSTQRNDFYGGNIPWIRTQEVNFNYIYDTEIKITNEWLQNSSARWIPKNTVIVAMYGNSAGRVAFCKIEATTNQACCNFIADYSKTDSKFIYFHLLNRYSEIEWMANGAAQQNLSVWILREIKILLPSLPEQKSIARLLSSFDDKIELLREQNETLERTAQTIFQEWFGKYGVEDELPRGWKVGKIGTEFDITIGRTPPRIEPEWFSENPTGKKWISIKDIGSSKTYIFKTSEYLTDAAIKKFNIPVIPVNTTILSFKMTVGKLTITTEEMVSNEAIAHLKIRDNSVLSTEFIYCYLQRLDFNSLWSTSSIVTAINSTMIKELEVLVPSIEKVKEFDKQIRPVFQKIHNNLSQIEVLSKTRDELLPRLMSGAVRMI
jgi:type I restriction enzyme, S subunit